MPKGVYNRKKSPLLTEKPAAGGSIMPTEPVRPQIKELAGMNLEELKEMVPDSTAGASAEEEKPKRKYTKRTPESTPSIDPLMDDPRYKKAISGMVGFGGTRFIKTPFDVAAVALDNDKMRLQEQEEERIDDYFYVVSKRSNIDPAKPWFLAIYGLAMVLELVVKRVWIYNSKSFANSLTEFFGFKIGEQESQEQPQ